MVGAQRIGEFSWSIESLLNRVISQTLLRSPDIVSIVRDAVAAMPQLIDEIDGGELASIDIAAIMTRADALSGREGRRRQRRPCLRPRLRRPSRRGEGPRPRQLRWKSRSWIRCCARFSARRPPAISWSAPVPRALRPRRCAAPGFGGALSRLPHAERHRQDGRRAPGHQGRRADGALRPQALRQRPRHEQ